MNELVWLGGFLGGLEFREDCVERAEGPAKGSNRAVDGMGAAGAAGAAGSYKLVVVWLIQTYEP